MKNNHIHYFYVTLPSIQYEWDIDSDDKGIIGEDGVFISKDKEGYVNIHVLDKNIDNNTAEGQAKVVYPHQLDIEITDVTKELIEQKTLLRDDGLRVGFS